MAKSRSIQHPSHPLIWISVSVYSVVPYPPKFSKADGSKKWESLEAENRIVFYGLQKGYAAFTVSASARQKVQTYITNQQEHHRKKTFREELVAFLRKSEVEFDERYLD